MGAVNPFAGLSTQLHPETWNATTAVDLRSRCRGQQSVVSAVARLRERHGGPNYERLVHSGKLVMQLHRWEVEHHHGPIGDPNDLPPGNGLLLWFEIDDIDAAIARAEAMGAEVIMPRHRNPPDGDGGPNHWEIWLRDLDGYKVVLASPDGTADGNWRP